MFKDHHSPLNLHNLNSHFFKLKLLVAFLSFQGNCKFYESGIYICLGTLLVTQAQVIITWRNEYNWSIPLLGKW